MNLTIEQLSALLKLYPQIVKNVDGVAYDADGIEVAYDLQAVTAQAETDAQAEATAKTAALAKLAALGLTPADLTALGL